MSPLRLITIKWKNRELLIDQPTAAMRRRKVEVSEHLCMYERVTHQKDFVKKKDFTIIRFLDKILKCSCFIEDSDASVILQYVLCIMRGSDLGKPLIQLILIQIFSPIHPLLVQFQDSEHIRRRKIVKNETMRISVPMN